MLKHSHLIDHLNIDYRTKVSGSRLKGMLKLPLRFLQWVNRKLRGYDLVIVAHYGNQDRAIRIAMNCKTPKIVAHIEDEFVNQYKDERLELIPFRPNLHEVEGVCAVLDALQAPNSGGSMSLAVDPEVEAMTREAIRSVFGHNVNRIVGLNLSASTPPRIWPAYYFADLIIQLSEKYPDINFLINGQSKDLNAFDSLLKCRHIDTGSRVLLYPTPSLQSLFACIKTCSIYVSSEGGSVHMAAALGVPQVAFYQNVHAKLTRWYPWGATHKLLLPDNETSPISDIKPSQVAGAVSCLLDAPTQY